MQAMKDGIKVDENVLKDYPDLLSAKDITQNRLKDAVTAAGSGARA